MSVKDTYKGWRTTLFGIIVQIFIGMLWATGTQAIDFYSGLIFLAGFGLWFMPDTIIHTIKRKLHEQQQAPADRSNQECD